MDATQVVRLYTRKATRYHSLFVERLGYGRRLRDLFRESPYVRSGLKALDAGCGTGAVTQALYTVAHERRCTGVVLDAFDLTPAMLHLFHRWRQAVGAAEVSIREADARNLSVLPDDWRDYGLVVVSAMLEYIPRQELPAVIGGLRGLLGPEGVLVALATRRTLPMRLWMRWWHATLFRERELQTLFRNAGFSDIRVQRIWHGGMYMVQAW